MKAKTKLQILVNSLTHKLPKLTDIQKQWAFGIISRKCYVYKLKHEAICFECGHKWKEEDNILKEYMCPNCNKTLHATERKNHSRTDEEMCCIATTYKEFQVIQYFYIERYCRKGYEASYWIAPVCEHWINSKGKVTIIGLLFNNNYYNARWKFSSKWEIRQDLDKYYVNCEIYPRSKYLDIIKRNGFTGNTHKLSISYLFQIILKYPIAETLLKSGQYDMLGLYFNSNIDTINSYWNSIKICIRNNYTIKSAKDWLDHIKLLEYFQKDIYSPKYICPDNFQKEKQRYINKYNTHLEKERIKALKKKIEETTIKYLEEKKKFLNLKITDGTLVIVPLKDTYDFYVEGKILHHCVFSNEYYKFQNSLILSARKDNQRIETVEVDIRNFRIYQCRGVNNQNSEYHDQIINLVQKNMKEIKKCSKQKQLIEV